ncbi:MAG: MarR family transcriptional regulator [Pseudomonadota bacterium]
MNYHLLLMTAHRTANLLGVLSLLVSDQVAARLAAEDPALSLAEAATLATLRDYPGLGVEALAQILRLSQAGTSRLLARLEAAGLLARVPSQDDRRARRVDLTETGVARADRVRESRISALQGLLAGLGPQDVQQLEALLERMLMALDISQLASDQACRLCSIKDCPQDRCPIACAVSQQGNPVAT